MAPKFRGGSDDWLDNEEKSLSGRSAKGGKKGKPKGTALPPEQANAVVAEVFPNQCRVVMDEGAIPLLCSYKRSKVILEAEDGIRERSPVAVGDRVLVQQSNPVNGVVEGVCERRNRLFRPAPGNDTGKVQHVIAANLDLLLIAASVRRPDFSPGLVDRYLIAAQAAGIPALVCITKTDLVSEELSAPGMLYRELGFEVIEVCSKRDEGIAELRTRLTGRVAAFCGHSGVGKTSLLSALLGADVGRIGEVSESTGKGRHTTTAAILLGGPEGSQWIDTPGVKSFGLADVQPEALATFFPEFRDLPCSATGCHHEDEAACSAAVLPRYSSYRRILQSLREGEN